MKPDSNQAARFFASAKIHKFEELNDITVENPKSKAVVEYCKPFTEMTESYPESY